MSKTKFKSKLKAFMKEPQWEKVRGLLWIVFILLVVHILWRYWNSEFNFAPFSKQVNSIRQMLSHQVFYHSIFIANDILKMELPTFPDYSIRVNAFMISVPISASGVKQMVQFIILFLILPGPWKHKAWFIPLGLLLIYFTNVVRVVSMIVLAKDLPRQVEYAHDNYLRLLVYFVIFLLWIIWMEKIRSLKS